MNATRKSQKSNAPTPAGSRPAEPTVAVVKPAKPLAKAFAVSPTAGAAASAALPSEAIEQAKKTAKSGKITQRMNEGKPAMKPGKAEKSGKSDAPTSVNKSAKSATRRPPTAKAALKALRKRTAALKATVKRSKLIRLSLQTLNQMSDQALAAALAVWPTRTKKKEAKAAGKDGNKALQPVKTPGKKHGKRA